MYIVRMPSIRYIRIPGAVVMVHTREHGFPHITIYAPKKKNAERTAKLRIDTLEFIESNFSAADEKRIVAAAKPYQSILMEEWNVWVKRQKAK